MPRAVLLIVTIALAAACSDGTAPGGSSVPAADQVFMQGSAFNPTTRTVASGTTVTWVNKDLTTHNVISSTVPGGAATFNSGNVGSNGTFQVTFTIAGTYEYFCSFHGSAGAGMRATVVVN